MAFEIAKKKARGRLIEDRLNEFKVKMMDSVVFNNFYILHFDESTMSDNDELI